MKRIFAVILLGLAFGSWVTVATADDAVGLLTEQSYLGVPYLTGGVGEDESMQILARAKDFNLKLVFAEKAGAYLADVELVVVDTKGHAVLAVKSAGPLLLARLPAGSYRAKATFDGQVQQKAFAVSAKRRAELTLLW